MEKIKVKILSGFRLTIPEEARSKIPIKIGDELDFVMEGNKLIYIMRTLPEDPVFAMIGLTSGEARKLSEIEEAVVEEVKEKLKRS
ncbi:AbrB/MazE/SpoVT family DNA-binding domain-containing protein [Candidatus Bathyarchaeota archaeon]|nr:AbrB/MazE/SpoVT family DNA-binding domain-containing protein [Candidatus Bathyarchaeota archaeon]